MRACHSTLWLCEFSHRNKAKWLILGDSKNKKMEFFNITQNCFFRYLLLFSLLSKGDSGHKPSQEIAPHANRATGFTMGSLHQGRHTNLTCATQALVYSLKYNEGWLFLWYHSLVHSSLFSLHHFGHRSAFLHKMLCVVHLLTYYWFCLQSTNSECILCYDVTKVSSSWCWICASLGLTSPKME